MSDRILNESKLIFPGLAGFYGAVSDLWYPMIRIALGLILFMHGWAKYKAGFAAEVDFFVRVGFILPAVCAFAVIFFETVGALCVAAGLLTRFFAAALAIELGVMFLFIHLPNGFSASKGGYEYVLLMGVVMFAIALRGGGRFSVDRLVGKEL
jgi:putative oxidoreductase